MSPATHLHSVQEVASGVQCKVKECCIFHSCEDSICFFFTQYARMSWTTTLLVNTGPVLESARGILLTCTRSAGSHAWPVVTPLVSASVVSNNSRYVQYLVPINLLPTIFQGLNPSIKCNLFLS